MMPRSAPAGISGSHHWMNSISVCASAPLAPRAQTAAAATIVARNPLTFMLASHGSCSLDPFRIVPQK